MFTKPLLLVALLVAVVQVTGHFTSGGDFCTDEKNRKDTCKPLVNHAGCGCSHEGSHEGSHGSSEASGSGPSSGSGSGSGSGEESSGSGSGSGSSSGSGVSSGSGSGGEWESGEYCFLLQFFLQISVQLDVQIQEIFVEWINITQITIVEDVTLTEYEILVKIWYSLTILFEEHFEIEKLVRFAYIPNWGYGCDLEGLAIDLQTETTQITIEEVITLGGSNNSCPLLDALEACGNEASSSDSAKIQVFISQLKVIIKKGFSFSETLVLIYEQFQIFFQANPSLLALINSGEIEEFGILQSYIDICAVYWRIKNFSVAVGGSTSNCSLINGLHDLWTNTSFNISQRSDFKQLWNKTLVYFQSETDVKLRLTYFVEQVYQFLILEEWDISEIYQVEIEGYGTIYQLIYAYIYCTDNGIGSGEFTGGPEETTTTTTKTSTSTKTSTTTTKPTTTTTVPNGNCNTIPTCNALSNNVTILITAIQNDQQTPHWNATLIATFKGYLGSIWRYSSNTTATELQKFTAIKGVLTGFTTKADFKAIVYAIFIQGWGTIQEYITCTTV